MKIRLTKGELKKQRDALRQYERYLPTLQLKKQQLQLEILQQYGILGERKRAHSDRKKAIQSWAGLIPEAEAFLKARITPAQVITRTKNVAGVDLPVFERAEFVTAEYDLFLTPLWVDAAVEALRQLITLAEEVKVIERDIETLKRELRITTQRVNLFEKVKIPESKEAIRVIKIYLGDQMANAVGRSKIAKKKIEESVLEEVIA